MEVQLHYNVYELFCRNPARRALQTRSLPNPTLPPPTFWLSEDGEILEREVISWVQEQVGQSCVG